MPVDGEYNVFFPPLLYRVHTDIHIGSILIIIIARRIMIIVILLLFFFLLLLLAYFRIALLSTYVCMSIVVLIQEHSHDLWTMPICTRDINGTINK